MKWVIGWWITSVHRKLSTIAPCFIDRTKSPTSHYLWLTLTLRLPMLTNGVKGHSKVMETDFGECLTLLLIFVTLFVDLGLVNCNPVCQVVHELSLSIWRLQLYPWKCMVNLEQLMVWVDRAERLFDLNYFINKIIVQFSYVSRTMKRRTVK